MVNRLMGAVGERSINDPQDVGIVQHLLNLGHRQGGVPKQLLEVDGRLGPKTLSAIREFQQKYRLVVDGKVLPNGDTLLKLHQVAGHLMTQASDGKKFFVSKRGPSRVA